MEFGSLAPLDHEPILKDSFVRTVSYDRQTIHSPNPLARFAHRSRARKSVAVAEKQLPKNGMIVDFGAGTGLFLTTLGDKRADAKLVAIEPFMPPSSDARIRYIRDFAALNQKADMITAFEVCEHLTDVEMDRLLSEAAAALQTNGKFIVSVPIMIGAALPLKELNRIFLFRRASDYSARELISGTFGLEVPQPLDRAPTHKGFDFRTLRKKLGAAFMIEKEILSPLPLPWWANSQIFFICHKA